MSFAFVKARHVPEGAFAGIAGKRREMVNRGTPFNGVPLFTNFLFHKMINMRIISKIERHEKKRDTIQWCPHIPHGFSEIGGHN